MTRYTLLSDSFAGNLTFYFDSSGHLVEFQVNSWDMGANEYTGFMRYLPQLSTDNLFMAFVKKFRYKIRRDKIDLSFDRFMDMYGLKRDSFKAEPYWKKMGESDKYYTLVNLRLYNRYCQRNPEYPKMYPAAYLRNHRRELWDLMPDFGKPTATFTPVEYDERR